MDINDFMSSFLGGGMGGPHRGGGGGGGRQRSRDVGSRLPVTLEDLYNGKEVDIPHRRTIPCESCKGRGVKAGAPQATCALCRGNGSRVIVQQMGMMVQQMRTVCDGCGGTGERIDPQNRCTACGGRKVSTTEEAIKVVVEPGMSHQQQLRFPGKGDFEPGTPAAGALVIVLEQQKHPRFVRKDCDLYMLHKISLAEALCGFQFKILHLDGRELVARRARGEITRPGDVQCIVGEGMPIAGQTGRFGDMIIEFEVSYPDLLEDAQIRVLRSALAGGGGGGGSAAPPQPDPQAEICYVNREDIASLKREIEKDEEENDEEEGGARGAQPGCAAQ